MSKETTQTRLPADVVEAIERKFHLDRWMSPREVAQQLTVELGRPMNSTTTGRHYPFMRYSKPNGKLLKVTSCQAIDAVRAWPKATFTAISAKTGISPHMLRAAKAYEEWQVPETGVLKGLKAGQVPDPQPTCEEQVPQAKNEALAHRLTEERAAIYGHPGENFRRIAAGHDIIFNCEDREVRHALDMIWVKVCRLIETPDHQDSIDDIQGYAETINMLHTERQKRGAG